VESFLLDVTLGREFLVGLICAGEFGDFRQIVTLDSVTLDRVDCNPYCGLSTGGF
jgi:hypothetical protein